VSLDRVRREPGRVSIAPALGVEQEYEMAKQNQDDKIGFGAFVNRAKSYCHYADLLVNRPNPEADPKNLSNDPIYLLYFHAAELALKAF
jgi:hypothetical protein